MTSLSALAIIASLAAFPISSAVGGTVLLATTLGWIIHADYVQRHRRIRLPRLPGASSAAQLPMSSRSEQHPLAI